jgi:hypothetical protein
VPILDDGLLRELEEHISAHPKAVAGEGPGHSKLSYDHEFDPKGFYRYTFKPAAGRAGFRGLHVHELITPSQRWRWSLTR